MCGRQCALDPGCGKGASKQGGTLGCAKLSLSRLDRELRQLERYENGSSGGLVAGSIRDCPAATNESLPPAITTSCPNRKHAPKVSAKLLKSRHVSRLATVSNARSSIDSSRTKCSNYRLERQMRRVKAAAMALARLTLCGTSFLRTFRAAAPVASGGLRSSSGSVCNE